MEMAASAGAVAGLLDYVYGGEPTVASMDAVELLRLADAYELPHLATELETQLVASLDSTAALGLLRESSTLGTLKLQQACEDTVAADFQRCSQQASFLELPEWRLARLLKREDLEVQREEVVLQGLWRWMRASEDRGRCLGTMLQLIDLQSLSQRNLERLRLSAQSLGGHGFIIQTEADVAIKKRSAISDAGDIRAKRHRLSQWSVELGAGAGGEEIHLKGRLKGRLKGLRNMCWHDGWIYISDWQNCTIVRWKPGTDQIQVVAGQGAQVNGVNDLGNLLFVGVSPKGEIVVGDIKNRRLVKFEDGRGEVLIEETGFPFFSPNGVLYILSFDGKRLQRLDGATLRTVIASDDLPQEQQFVAVRCVASKDEVIYLSDRTNNRILRLSPGDSEVTVVGTAAAESQLVGLTLDGDTVYVADPNFSRGSGRSGLVNRLDRPPWT